MPADIRKEVRQVGVLGAGTMGNGIPQAFAAAGYPVIMRDIKPEFLDCGNGDHREEPGAAQRSWKIAGRGAQCRPRPHPSDEIKDLARCDLVIEAVLENYDLKAEIIRGLDAICGETAILPPTLPLFL